jgi:hypothetical protein
VIARPYYPVHMRYWPHHSLSGNQKRLWRDLSAENISESAFP